MVINVVFGTAVNAARQLSWTVIHSIQIFVNNFTMAIWPQVTQSYAAGERDYMMQLLFRGAKFSFYIMWMVFLPLILETEFVVGLWLGEYPDHTINFLRLSLVCNLISTLQIILGMGIKATGKIQWMQISFSMLEFLAFFMAFIMLHHGFSPEWVYYNAVMIHIMKVLVMLRISKKQLEIPPFQYIRAVILPTVIVVLVSSCLPLLLRFSMPDGWLRFIIILLTSVAISAASILYLGCIRSERDMLINLVLSKIRKVRS